MEMTIVKSPAIQAMSPIVLDFGAFTAEFVLESLVAVGTEATEDDICYYEVFVYCVKR
jgi:hypothetical protein